MPVNISIPSLGNKFQDYRQGIPGDSFNWGPVITPSQVKYLAYHHSVTKQTAKNDGNWKAECDAIANIHIKSNGWGGVGYRFIICSDGTVAYVGDLGRGGSAVGGNNNIIFSACLVGDFTKELPTASQVHSAHLLAKWFLTETPQYPQLDSFEKVIGHKDAYALLKLPGSEPTACPGSNWRAEGDSLRDRIINDRWQGYPKPEPQISQPTPTPTPTPQPPSNDDRDKAVKILQEAQVEFNHSSLEGTARALIGSARDYETVKAQRDAFESQRNAIAEKFAQAKQKADEIKNL